MEDIKLWMTQHLHEHTDTLTNNNVSWSLAVAAIKEFKPGAEDAFEFFDMAKELCKDEPTCGTIEP